MIESNDVFISYRRSVSDTLALLVYQDLRSYGISAFYDIESIDSGQFDTIILNQIATRPYFLPILTAGTLDRCVSPVDWFRREIEYALALGRMIVPLYTDEFDWLDIDRYLPDAVASELKRYQGVPLPTQHLRFFRYAMQDLRGRFLTPITFNVMSAPGVDEAVVQCKIEQIDAEALVTSQRLDAYRYFEKALARPKNDPQGIIADYTRAIDLNPLNAAAYNNRGNAYFSKGDIDNAMADYQEAVRLDARYATLYHTRGIVDSGKNHYIEDGADAQDDKDNGV